MKDAFHLMITGAALSVIAWALWHYGAQDAFGSISTITLIGVVADNVRLRRALRTKYDDEPNENTLDRTPKRSSEN
jgi:hypothetical protein